MYTCPACGGDGVAGQARCRCGADLTLLASLASVADTWFNLGVAASAQGEWGEALQWFSASCAARPGDGGVRLAQARAWARLGQRVEADKALAQARELGVAEDELAARQDQENGGRDDY